jgi:DNA gyrase subunit A
MMITTEGIIIQIRMQDVSTLGRITSGVKLMNLDENVTIAQIAKVREKLSDGNEEIDNLDDIIDEAESAEVVPVEEAPQENE